MKTYPNNQVVAFDVDETLVLNYFDPSMDEIINVNYSIYSQQVLPHWAHIEKLIQAKKDGKMVIVWSAGGSEWAVAVVKKLKLVEYVDLIITKPEVYYDDLDANEWMDRKYIEPGAKK